MSITDTFSTATCFPAPQSLQTRARRFPAPDQDHALVQLCMRLTEDQQSPHHFDAIDPRDWERVNREKAALEDLIRCIADIGATGLSGLRAKALALHVLLADGGEALYEDAAAPDLLAWSLVRDILADWSPVHQPF